MQARRLARNVPCLWSVECQYGPNKQHVTGRCRGNYLGGRDATQRCSDAAMQPLSPTSGVPDEVDSCPMQGPENSVSQTGERRIIYWY